MGLKNCAKWGRRTATRTRQSRLASSRTTFRPKNPDPPNTTASLLVTFKSSAAQRRRRIISLKMLAYPNSAPGTIVRNGALPINDAGMAQGLL
jgi:hypothetical protein